MKRSKLLVVLGLVLALAASMFACGCGCPDTLGGKIDDALDSRPAEKLQDKAEDIRDQIKDATN